MHEIVTTQIGRQANYVGTHFWNAQESYHTFGSEEISPVNHDIHFRQGIAPDGSDTYLPRALIYDLKGGFGSLARINALGADVDESEQDDAWAGRLDRLQMPGNSTPSPFLRSLVSSEAPVFPTASTTAYFSDFASTFYHPRSLIPVTPAHPVLDPGAQATTNDLPSFTSFADGSSLFSELDSAVDIFDRDLRPWIEECDSPQGVQLFASADDAWSGFAASYVEDLRDRLGKGSVWVWGLTGLEQRLQERSTRLLKTLNHALALAAFNNHASLYIPVSPSSTLDSSVQLDRSVLWHTSALASAAIESASLPVRLRASDGRRVPLLGDWEDAIGDGGRRKVAELAFEAGTSAEPGAMANGHGHDHDHNNGNPSGGGGNSSGAATDTRMVDAQLLEDEETEQEAANTSLPIDLFQPTSSLLQASQPLRSKTFARIDAFRGPGWNLPTSHTIVEQDLRFLRRGRPVIEAFQTNEPLLPLVATFPHIFTGSPAPGKTTTATTTTPPGMRAHTSLRTSSKIANWIRDVEETVRRTPAALMDVAMAGAERESLRHELGSMAEMYVEGWDSGDEFDDDEEE